VVLKARGFCRILKHKIFDLVVLCKTAMYLFGFRPHLTAGGPEAVLLAFHKLRMKEVGTGKRGSLTLSYPKAFVMPFKGEKPNLCKMIM
jgi:hypothetical protein